MGINTSGVPSSSEYLIGRGILYAAELNADGTPKSFKDLGNVPEMSLTVDSEQYEHFSSREGLRTRDLTVTIEQTADISFVMENVKDFDNLKLFFSGESSTYTNPAVAGWTGATLITDDNIVANAWYVLVDGSGNPVFQIDKSNLTIETTNATPVTLVEGTDYTVDEISGQIFIKDTAVVQTAITNNEGLTTDYTADASAGAVSLLEALTKTSVTVALRFVSEDANTQRKIVYDMHKVTLAADGDYNLISDEATQAPMTGSIEKSEAYTGTISIYDAEDRS